MKSSGKLDLSTLQGSGKAPIWEDGIWLLVFGGWLFVAINALIVAKPGEMALNQIPNTNSQVPGL